MDRRRAVRSRELRRAQTLAEHRAWYHLRNRNVAGLKFRRQQAVDHYTVDFYCPELRLAIELDGGVHSQPSQLKKDKEKDEYLRASGIHVLRISNGLVLEDPEGFVKKLANFTPHPVPQGGTTLSRGGEGRAKERRDVLTEAFSKTTLSRGGEGRGAD